MKQLLIVALAVATFALLWEGGSPAAADHRAAAGNSAGAGAAAGSGHGTILPPERLEWKDSPAMPPGVKVAVLEGDPTKEGFFAMRVKLPDGCRIAPHWHPCFERVTVLSGTFCLGKGEKFQESAAQPLPAGSYWSMEPGMRHFAFARGETVVQVATVGPWGINYVNPDDDPRKKR